MASELVIPRQGTGRTRLLGAALVLLVAAILYGLFPSLIVHHYRWFEPTSTGVVKRIFAGRIWIIQLSLFSATWLSYPWVRSLPWSRLEKPAAARTLIACLAAAMFSFVLLVGNHQFGGWDYSILVDTGWRQMLGQHPYTDFITPNPPGFNLGVYVAFRLFGVTWNAQLFAIGGFCVATFAWLYWLQRTMAVERRVAIALAFLVECVTVLPVCFWWYNDTTSVLGAVFLLAAIVAVRAAAKGFPVSPGVWVSYSVSLGLLALMKPNIAGLLILPAGVVVLLVSRSRWTALLATACGIGLALSILGAAHVSLPAMVDSYRGAAIERGGFSHFGLDGYRRSEKLLLWLWVAALATPLWSVRSRLSGWRDLGLGLLLWLPVPITVYGMATNGEWKDSEAAGLILVGGLVAMGFGWAGPRVRRGLICLLVCITGANLFYGLSRDRVFGIMNHGFYEYSGADLPVHDGFFQGMHSSAYFSGVEAEIRRAVREHPGPVFLGPRLEFDYADLRLPSPKGWPVYYQPGTSFPRRDSAKMTKIWVGQHFGTLIFLHGDRTFYADDLLALIANDYVPVQGYQNIDVLILKPSATYP